MTTRGLNLKIGKTYDTGIENLAGMNFFEMKGIAGEAIGTHKDTSSLNNSISSLRVRNFTADLKTGRGKQIDVQYDLNKEFGTASYSMVQALPKIGPFTLFPLAGMGVAYGNNVAGDYGTPVSGYSIPGTFTTVGTYSKLAITDKLWLNYNPMWMSTLSGSETYKNHGFENHSSSLMHEFVVSYQINPRFNVRYFSNWSEHTDFADGEHRVEFNYQL
jgi:hypothetical protein